MSKEIQVSMCWHKSLTIKVNAPEDYDEEWITELINQNESEIKDMTGEETIDLWMEHTEGAKVVGSATIINDFDEELEDISVTAN